MADARGIVLAVAMLVVAPAWAGVTWHADVATAKAAASGSRKPILAVFTATWSPESTAFERQVLTAPEVEAVLAACFETVRIDVDQRPGLTKRLEVSHVPSACVLGEDQAILARFDCPATAPAFVAAAARAAQHVASATAGAAGNAAMAQRLVTDERSPADSAADDVGSPAGQAFQADPHAAGQGSIALVTTKVRQLSDFAAEMPAGDTAAPSSTPSAAALPAATEPPPSRFVSSTPLDPPPLPRSAPPAWPAESAGRDPAFTNAPQPSASPAAIEPQSAATPWIASAAAAGSPRPPVEPESSATASDLPAKPTSSSSWSSFVAAFQKPFSIFTKPAKTADPPTMPPARPSSPLASTTPATPPVTPPPAAPAGVPPAGPDPYGSMPLGLEGYCPVTLAERGVWMEGRAQWGARHRGRTYLFAGPEQQQAFLAAPDRYAPVLSGDDPVAVIDQGKSLPGRRAYGVTYQSRMYLFSSPESRARFAANPERYTATAMLAERPAPVDATRRY